MARQRARYLQALIMKHVVREAPGLGTVGVTANGFILVDYAWLADKTVAECAGLWVHEVLHPFLQHAQRRGRREPGRWNRAGDRAINPMVVSIKGLELPDGGCWPKDLELDNGLLSDVYYEADKPEDGEGGEGGEGGQPGDDEDQGGQPGKGDGEGDGEGEGQGEGDDEGEGQGGSQGGSQGSRPRKGGKARSGSGKGAGEPSWGGNCGSGAGGKPLPGEPDATDPGARSEGELHRAIKAVAEAVKQAASSGRGDVPMGLLLAAEDLLKPSVVPWDEKLRRAARRAVAFKMGAFDYRYDAPSRRQAGVGFGWGKPVLPRMRCPVPEVAVVIDTSGSMGSDELQRAVSETAGVMRSVGAPVTFLCCDAEVHGVQRIADPTKVVLKGGGGTSFQPAFKALEELRPKPSVVVFVTDGCGDAPVKPPRHISTIWVLVGPHQRKPCAGEWGGPEVTWGDFVAVPNEADEEAA
jgi:predicted metal-dependent peptidase